MKNLFAAIRFITILPAGRSEHFDALGMVPWFPVVGLLLGALLAVFDLAASHLWPVSAVSILDVILLAILTGAFHLDGLGDTADGLLSHRLRERILEIMKDSRIGVMGVVAVVSVLAVKWAGISGLGANRTAFLILVPAYARCGMLFGMRALDYGRPQGGTALPFFSRTLRLRNFWALIPVAILSLALGLPGLTLTIGFTAITAALVADYRRRLGCITGDMLGAMAEVTEAGLFLLAAAGGLR
jgi:adenosylcobinamide-GDP ribazoletransferase